MARWSAPRGGQWTNVGELLKSGGQVAEVLEDFGFNGAISSRSTWLAYLERTARLGFSQVEAEDDPTPADCPSVLSTQIYDVPALVPCASLNQD